MSDSSYDSDSEEEDVTSPVISSARPISSQSAVSKKKETFPPEAPVRNKENVTILHSGPNRSYTSPPQHTGRLKEMDSYSITEKESSSPMKGNGIKPAGSHFNSPPKKDRNSRTEGVSDKPSYLTSPYANLTHRNAPNAVPEPHSPFANLTHRNAPNAVPEPHSSYSNLTHRNTPYAVPESHIQEWTLPLEPNRVQTFSQESRSNFGNNGRNYNKKGFVPGFVGYKRLLDWANNPDTTTLVFQMSMDVSGLRDMLSAPDINFDWIQLLITALHKILEDAQKGSLHYVLNTICESTFFDFHFKKFLQQMINKRGTDARSLFEKILDIIEYLIDNVKNKQHTPKYNQALFFILKYGEVLKVFNTSPDLLAKTHDLRNKVGEPLNENRELMINPTESIVIIHHEKNKRKKYIPMADDDTPPDDYETMAIFPETAELYSPIEPFLRANKTKGAYRDLRHYLDIHARLVKEDYLAPIRDGLKQYKEALANDEKAREHDLRFYYDVKIQMKEDEEQGITHWAIFDNTGMENIEWEYSKRLMFGSLLVFSKDNFETTIFATVETRDPYMLKKGIVVVVFQNNLDVIFTASENDRFIMAETTAYFESHRHVLEGLQEMRKLPLDRYILSCKKEVRPPVYLKKNPTYNLACIMKDKYDNFPVSVFDEVQWPDSFNTTLNDSQVEALKLALTSEMAIIQGPPGTGKTYIGLKIMKILLENNVTKDTSETEGPILVVCYTNHALDQFLEGILDFCTEGIVRVGGRSSSKLLENYNLKALRSNPSFDRKIETNIKRNLINFRKELKAVSVQVKQQWQESLHLETTIVNTDDLRDEMEDFHYCQLSDTSRLVNSSHQNVLRTWLKAANANMENFLFKAAKRHLVKVIAAEPCIEEKSDLGLTSKLTATKVIPKERVKIYRFWLNKHKSLIEEAINMMLDSGRGGVPEQLLQDQETANSDILSDEILVKYMSNENIYVVIKECVELENKTCNCDNNYIRAWLMNNFTKTDQLLDAIEQLTEKKKDQPPKKGINIDSEAKVHDSRWVIDDSESDTSSTETDDEESESDTGMNDIDDIGMSFKELSRNYKLHENKEIQMLQRAERLRIDLSEKQDDEEEGEWQEVSMSYGKVFSLFHKTEAFTKDQASKIDDIWKLNLRDRYKLYKFWVQSKKRQLSKNLIGLTEKFKDILQRKKEAKSLKDIEILRRARVIGMTTTGAAKHRKVLQSIGCRIIIVEEAAEVLEAHIVTTLNNKCEHLILIGDHQQLRPSPTVYKLAVDYSLEISLFERLIKNDVPHVTLTEQHRMRPEISQFIRHIYPNLEDHYSVTGYDDIRGVNSNVFFLQHSQDEKGVDDSTSKANLHEAQFVTALCKYFLQHGYLGKQVTILAAYSGQVSCIRNEMEPEKDFFEGVRVTSIDNYQGEENIIVLLSLVRSNKDNEVGFLKTDNRVCVALSRAKKGMFVIGNLPLLAKKSKLWHSILTQAQDERVTGINIKLVCVNHANHVTYVQTAEDFSKEVPEGGCNRKCNAVLPCGHICPRMCHASDRHHEETQCEQPCMKTCPKGHLCQKKCQEACGDCEVIVKKNMPLCGHEDNVPCFRNVEEVLCSQLCGQIMACGHICHGQCGKCLNDADHQPCLEKVDLTWPACQHTANVECKTDVKVDPCPERCLQHLDCGHACKGTCGGCLSGRVHRPCSEKCKRALPCGHPCNGPCGGQCIPCDARCVVFCRHRPCNKKTCGELCDPCTENCALTCQHKECNLRCMDECRIPSCSKSCGKPTKCKHKCFSLCGEPCVCYPCEKEKFSLIDTSGKKRPKYAIAHDKRERAKKFEVESDTVLMKIPKCGHIFTISQLDKWVESFEPSNSNFIKCPNCSAPMMGIARYENINKQRTEKRENLKADLIKKASVRTESINVLKDAKAFVGNFCHIDEGDFLTRKPEEIDANHALALSLQIRFSYVLAKIYKIHQDFSEKATFAIRKWKLIINSINRNVTEQFFKEMTLELHRLLIHLQIHILMSFLQDIDRQLPPDLKTTCKSILKDNKQKLTAEDRVAFQGIVTALYNRFADLEPDNHWQIKTTRLCKKSEKITEILDHTMDEDLKTVLG